MIENWFLFCSTEIPDVTGWLEHALSIKTANNGAMYFMMAPKVELRDN